jgi:hypothetical protein
MSPRKGSAWPFCSMASRSRAMMGAAGTIPRLLGWYRPAAEARYSAAACPLGSLYLTGAGWRPIPPRRRTDCGRRAKPATTRRRSACQSRARQRGLHRLPVHCFVALKFGSRVVQTDLTGPLVEGVIDDPGRASAARCLQQSQSTSAKWSLGTAGSRSDGSSWRYSASQGISPSAIQAERRFSMKPIAGLDCHQDVLLHFS